MLQKWPFFKLKLSGFFSSKLTQKISLITKLAVMEGGAMMYYSNHGPRAGPRPLIQNYYTVPMFTDQNGFQGPGIFQVLEKFRSWIFPGTRNGWAPWKFPGPEKIQVVLPENFQGPNILDFWSLADFIWKPPTMIRIDFWMSFYCIFPTSLGL